MGREHIQVTAIVFGEQVRYYRGVHGWDQREFAERIQKSVPTVSRLELGKQNLSMADIMVIADVLEVPVPILFGGAVTPLPPPTLEMLAAQAQAIALKAQEVAHEATTLRATTRALIGDAQETPPPEEEVPSSGLEYLGSEQYDPASVYEDDDIESAYACAAAM